MDGWFKIFYLNIYGGFLVVCGNEEYMVQINEYGIQLIDFVVVNFYLFKEMIFKEDVIYEEVIENIDIGGLGMLCVVLKNYQDVMVIVDLVDYSLVLN